MTAKHGAVVIVADGEVDQIVDTIKEAKQEVKELRAMGCTVRALQFDSWQAAQDYADGLFAARRTALGL